MYHEAGVRVAGPCFCASNTPFPFSLGLLPPRAPCQQRGFRPDLAGRGREMETESQGPEGLCPCPLSPLGKAGAAGDLPARPQCRTSGLALASVLSPFRSSSNECLQEPSQSLPPCSSPSSPLPAPASPHPVSRQDASRCGHDTTCCESRSRLPVKASGAPGPAGFGPEAGLRCSDHVRE